MKCSHLLRARCIIFCLVLAFFGGLEFFPRLTPAFAQETPPEQAAEHDAAAPADAVTAPDDSAAEHALASERPMRNYIFIHDTSKNMRKKKRIGMMQTAIRTLLNHASDSSRVGLWAFGHRFPSDGPDVCQDSEAIIAPDEASLVREDFDSQLNMLMSPPLGGGAPVGLALSNAIEDAKAFPEPKELLMFVVDLNECKDKPLEKMKAACQVPDLHLSLVGIGLKRDLQVMQEAGIDQLGCVDVINIMTPEEGDALPNLLLTRLSIQFKNSEDQLVDPAPGGELVMKLSQTDDSGKTTIIRHKVKRDDIKGVSLETTGLSEGTYLLDLAYEGEPIRTQQTVVIGKRQEVVEVVRLGKMLIDVTDFSGGALDESLAKDLTITLIDADKAIRAAEQTASAAFELLPGSQYRIRVSYVIGGKPQVVESNDPITIREGNHQYVKIALPVGSLAGRVVDMQGTPQPDAEVTLMRVEQPEGAAPFEQSAAVDQDGTFFFADIETGKYALMLSSKGYKRQGAAFTVIGGKINQLGDVRVFRGIEVLVNSAAGNVLPDAEVTITAKESGAVIPIARYGDAYGNVDEIPEGAYLIAAKRADHQAAAQEVTFRAKDVVKSVTFTLPYYVTVTGNVINSKGAPVPDARVTSRQTRSRVETPAGEKDAYGQSDGTFRVTLAVSSAGEEQLGFVWNDPYNQTHHAPPVTVTLPNAPGSVEVGAVTIPMNFVQLALTDITGEPIQADAITLTHAQSGMSGMPVTTFEKSVYESSPLLDGDYTMRVMKRGYQEVEQQISLRGGETKSVSAMLHNYVTVRGTLEDVRNNRIAGAVVTFQERQGVITSPQPIVTGKDGRFQATLLVNAVGAEPLSIVWKSPASGKEYQIAATVELKKEPVAKFSPKDLGTFQLPANFIRLSVVDVSGRGLPEADVQFISRANDVTKSVELGNGLYESLDLPDGTYNIAINKPGYKEHVVVSDIVVGQAQRTGDGGKVQLPHYATITGKIINGKDVGVSNVELFFGGSASEQLEQCRTDQSGHFSTVLLVNGVGKETWKASWQGGKFATADTFMLPAHPGQSVNIGDVRLPVNFISIPLFDARGQPLSGATVEIQAKDAAASGALTIEEIEPGMYQAQDLPNGAYTFSFRKEGYEIGKTLEVSVEKGMHASQPPVRLGYYVTLSGNVLNGRLQPVKQATVLSKNAFSVMLPPETSASAQPEATPAPEQSPSPDAQAAPAPLLTDDAGNFQAVFLVIAPGKEQFVVSWQEKFSTTYEVDFSNGPGTQQAAFKLPINFVVVNVKDISEKPLSGVTVTAENQIGKETFTLKETASGVYESDGIPDGNYVAQVSKEAYQSASRAFETHSGEQQELSCQLLHYITVKGHVIDGKREGVSAAVIAFGNLKTRIEEKTLSGTDGDFEAKLLVKEIGRESGNITWTGKYGTFTKSFWLDLPVEPKEVRLTEEQTLLPINFLSLELKSVAATGVPGATVTLTHKATNTVIDARDNDNGNYEGEELPDGLYDVSISKDQYQTITLVDIPLTGGEHRRELMLSKFLHYITISGTVINGKSQGVPGATVSIKNPKKLTDCEAFRARDDGSFTLSALVTDVGSETLDVEWNDGYRTSLPVKLPLTPDHVKLETIQLPINFITVKVIDIYNQVISGAVVSFAKKQPVIAPADLIFTGKEASPGVYDSPDLPDQTYVVVVKKEGYHQREYPEIRLQGGQTIANLAIELSHVITLKGRVTDGKGNGVPNAAVNIEGKSTMQGEARVETDASGAFMTHVGVIGSGEDALKLSYRVAGHANGAAFETEKTFIPLNQPGEQDFGELRLPINFIPLHVQDVAGKPIDDAQIRILSTEAVEAAGNAAEEASAAEVAHLGEGAYEGQYVHDGAYRVVVEKAGYKTQESSVEIASGDVAESLQFTLPHYVTVRGVVTDGTGNGVINAAIEFDTQQNQILPLAGAQDAPPAPMSTDIRGQFAVNILVNKAGEQRAKAVWNALYAKEFSVTLPEQPDSNLRLPGEIRLPINFAPFKITNISGQGLAGVDVRLQAAAAKEPVALLANSLGDGAYQARDLLDGTYALTVHKDGYQEMTGEFSVSGGELRPEQVFALPHYATISGTVVNEKGEGVAGAQVTLAGQNSKLLRPEEAILTKADGSFQADALVTGSAEKGLLETLTVEWKDPASPAALTFDMTHQFTLPSLPQTINVGFLPLPANFREVVVRDIASRGLAGVKVTFIDEQAREFNAKEVGGGAYEGQNLPNGTYVVTVSKEGYETARREQVTIISAPEENREALPITFRLPYYVQIEGVAVDGKGQQLASGVTLSLAGLHSKLLPETIKIDEQGHFAATLLVNSQGKEQLDLSWQGAQGVHALSRAFLLPDRPETVDFQRLHLPVNFIPIEVKDLVGNGISGAAVTLRHQGDDQDILAKEVGNGLYEGQYLLDGDYEIFVTKEGYKPSEPVRVDVAGGLVSETSSFRMRHYVVITGIATNGYGKGVNDPVITLDGIRSVDRSISSDITGKFEIKLEVKEVGNERMQIVWNNAYALPVTFDLPERPGAKDLGEIRLPINFVSCLVTDISGSMLPDVQIKAQAVPTGVAQQFRTDQNGFSKTDDLPNGQYQITASKAGYRAETRNVNLRDGSSLSLRFTLPHYLVIQGVVRDILQQPVGKADVVFEEFYDEQQQKLHTVTDEQSGAFEQKLLIDDALYLERQKGHFVVRKDNLRSVFTFKIPTLPNQVISYKTLLFPINYLYGKVVDKNVQTVPIADAQVVVTPVGELLFTDSGGLDAQVKTGVPQPIKLKTDSLGMFKMSNLPEGEYKISIEKEGYLAYEDFIRISGLFQEQEFTLRKQ